MQYSELRISVPHDLFSRFSGTVYGLHFSLRANSLFGSRARFILARAATREEVGGGGGGGGGVGVRSLDPPQSSRGRSPLAPKINLA